MVWIVLPEKDRVLAKLGNMEKLDICVTFTTISKTIDFIYR